MELTLDQALQKGIEAHKAGQFQEADRVYTAILKVQPKHPDANHNMGVLAVGVGKIQEALPFFKIALEVNPNITQFWLSYIDALIKLDRLHDAKALLDQAKAKGLKGVAFDNFEHRLDPSNTVQNEADVDRNKVKHGRPNILDTLKLDQVIKLAKTKLKEGLSEDARSMYQDILDKFPKNKNAIDGLKALSKEPGEKTSSIKEPPRSLLQPIMKLYNNGEFQKALEQCKKLMQQFPKSVSLQSISGISNKKLDNFDAAIQNYKNILEIKPDIAEIYYNLGNVMKAKGDLGQAIGKYKQAVQINPDYAEAYSNMGNALYSNDNHSAAIVAYKKAISIKPDYAEVYYNMGIALKELGKLENAVASYQKTIELKPDYAEAYNNMGIVLKEQGKLDDAIDAYSKAIEINPDFDDAVSNTIALLKVHNTKSNRNHVLVNLDRLIKANSSKIIAANSNEELGINLLTLVEQTQRIGLKYKTKLSQIYRRNTIDLNCDRHGKVFYSKDIIPEFCFGCYKVQVEVGNLLQLIKLASLFYSIEFEENLTRKTIIELRPNIPGFYKGLIYCRGTEQAKRVKALLDLELRKKFSEKVFTHIKRGCSEFPIRFPKYGEIFEEPAKVMTYPPEWKSKESEFDKSHLIQPRENLIASTSTFCLSDVFIIQKWIDYGKGLKDPTCDIFTKSPVTYPEIYDAAVNRKLDFGHSFL